MAYATVGTATRSGSLRDAIGDVGVLAADLSVTSTNVPVDCPGLSASLGGFSIWAIDGLIAYTTGTTPDLQLSFSTPPDTTGSTAFFPQQQGATGGVGDLEGFRATSFSDAFSQGAAGVAAGSLVCMPHGFVRTFRFGGAIQVRFAQVNATASTTTIHAGSWLRATLIGRLTP